MAIFIKVILEDGKALEGEWEKGKLDGLVRQVRRRMRNRKIVFAENSPPPTCSEKCHTEVLAVTVQTGAFTVILPFCHIRSGPIKNNISCLRHFHLIK